MWHLVVLLEELCERGINFRALAQSIFAQQWGANAVKVKQSAISKLLCDFYVSRRYSSETIM
ncbi:putative DNA-invertase from prophage CP4-44 [Escherichia coli TA054]|nr:putative DNA-invertase from prophage CP4-44 [Escherichia coli TA054]